MDARQVGGFVMSSIHADVNRAGLARSGSGGKILRQQLPHRLSLFGTDVRNDAEG